MPSRSALLLALLACGFLLGCKDASQPVTDMAQIEAEIEEARIEDELKQQLYESSGGRYGELIRKLTPSDLDAELQAKMKKILPDQQTVTKKFVQTIENLRAKNPWLDRSLDDPIDTPLVLPDGSSVGPTTSDQTETQKQFTNLLLDDYLANSSDSEDEKSKLKEVYEEGVFNLLYEIAPDMEIQGQIFSRHETGSVEPLVLFLNLAYQRLYDKNKLAVSKKILTGLRSRKCSAATKIVLIAESVGRWNLFPAEDRIALTKIAMEAVPDFFLELEDVQEPANKAVWAASYLDRLKNGTNHHGRVDLYEVVLDLYLSDQPKGILDDHIMHSLTSDLQLSIADNARGGSFMSEVSEANYEILSRFSDESIASQMLAFSLNPKDHLLIGTILQTQLRYSGTPYSVPMLYRIAMTLRSDSTFTTKIMARRTQPRWGGRIGDAERFTRQLMDAAKSSQRQRLLFDYPLKSMLDDRGVEGNLHERFGLTDDIDELFQHLEQVNNDKIDTRLKADHVTIFLRMCWDKGDLERVVDLIDRYNSLTSQEWLGWIRAPTDWLYRFAAFYKRADEQTQAALQVLQQDLFVGDEHYDEARFQRIDQAIDVMENGAAPVLKAISEDRLAAGQAEIPEFDYQSKSVQFMVEAIPRLRNIARNFFDGKDVELIGKASDLWIAHESETISYTGDSINFVSDCRTDKLLLTFPIRFEMPMTVEMRVQQNECDADPYGVALFVGPVMTSALESESSGRSLRYSPGYPMILQDNLPREKLVGEYYHEERLLPVPKQAILRIDAYPGFVTSKVNSKVITKVDQTINPMGYVGFGRKAGDVFSGVPAKKASYRILSFKVRPPSNKVELRANKRKLEDADNE